MESEVTVTEADREAVREYCRTLDVTLPQDCELQQRWLDRMVERWSPLVARARTLARFEERVANVIKCLETNGGMDAAGAIAGVNFFETKIGDLEEGEDIDVDMVRALVLKGWKP